MNTLAVATLADAACIVLAEDAALDETAKKKAAQQDITVLATELPVFDAALWIWQQMQVGAEVMNRMRMRCRRRKNCRTMFGLRNLI